MAGLSWNRNLPVVHTGVEPVSRSARVALAELHSILGHVSGVVKKVFGFSLLRNRPVRRAVGTPFARLARLALAIPAPSEPQSLHVRPSGSRTAAQLSGYGRNALRPCPKPERPRVPFALASSSSFALRWLSARPTRAGPTLKHRSRIEVVKETGGNFSLPFWQITSAILACAESYTCQNGSVQFCGPDHIRLASAANKQPTTATTSQPTRNVLRMTTLAPLSHCEDDIDREDSVEQNWRCDPCD